MKIRDKFWLFASRAHDDDIWLGKSTNDRLTRWSRITPAEGALMLGVPNVIMIGSDGDPAPFSAEAYGYMESFCRMKEVVWSITGSGGFRTGNEERFICELAKKYPRYKKRSRHISPSPFHVGDLLYKRHRKERSRDIRNVRQSFPVDMGI